MNMPLKNIGLAFLQALVLLSAILMIAFGIIRGETSVVLHKAIQICLECIGIG